MKHVNLIDYKDFDYFCCYDFIYVDKDRDSVSDSDDDKDKDIYAPSYLSGDSLQLYYKE